MKINKVLIYGCGLVGGSLALTLRQHHPHLTIDGVSRSQESIDFAIQNGVLDHGATSLSELSTHYDLAFIATPIETTPAHIKLVSEHIESPCVLTDVASIKQTIKDELPTLKPEHTMILGHPMAGSDRTGVEHATKDIMAGAHYILVPSPADGYWALKQLLQQCQFKILEMTAKEHDFRASIASHLPYLMACLTTDHVVQLPAETQAQVAPVLAKGFADSTRVSGSDPNWGVDICLKNAEPIQKGLAEIKERLTLLEHLIDTKNKAGLETFFNDVHQFKTKKA